MDSPGTITITKPESIDRIPRSNEVRERFTYDYLPETEDPGAMPTSFCQPNAVFGNLCVDEITRSRWRVGEG